MAKNAEAKFSVTCEQLMNELGMNCDPDRLGLLVF
jgi:hypothetical protein